MDVKKQYSRFSNPIRSGTARTTNRVELDHICRYEFAGQFIQGKRVLDIACGSGYGSRIMKEAGAATVHGVDGSPEMITYATRNHKIDGVQFSCDNAETLNTAGPFDVVASFETIEHVNDYHKTLLNMRDMLVPDGTLIISTPNRPVFSPQAKTMHDVPSSSFHVREFDLNEFQDIVSKAGFKVDTAHIYGQPSPKKLNRVTRKLNKMFGWFNDERFSSAVQPIATLPNLAFMVIVAKKSDATI